MRTIPLWPYLLMLLQGLLYGFGDPISKEAYELVSVFALLSVRYAIALLFLLVIFGRRIFRGIQQCRIRDLLPTAFCIACAYLIENIGMKQTAATSIAFLRSMSTVITPLLAFLLFRRKFSPRHLPVLFFAVVGLYLLCGHGGLSAFGMGEICGLCAALLLAASLVLSERALNRVDPLVLTFVQITVSVILASGCAAVFDGGWHLESATPAVWASICYLGVLCTLAGFLLQNKALCHISSRTVALLQCFSPVMTTVFSYFILGEHLTPAGMIGAVLLLGCVAAETCIKTNDTNDPAG